MNQYSLYLENNEVVHGLSRFEVLQLSNLDGYKNSMINENGNIIPLSDWVYEYYNKMFLEDNFVFIGEKLSNIEGLLVFRWLYPKAWRLLRFEYQKGIFKLNFEGKEELCFSKDDFHAMIDIDKAGRRLITININNGTKHKFFEGLVNYPEIDFDLIIQLLEAKESNLMKVSEKLMKINKSLHNVVNKL